MSNETGGLSVINMQPLDAESKFHRIRLLTDLHLGAAHNDEALIREELDDAKDDEGRILLGGDVMDLILPTDRKRYTPDVVKPELQGRRDALNAQVEYATDFLAPYANHIDGIGIGNHETHVEKQAAYDPARQLIENLNQLRMKTSLRPIRYMGYMAFIQYAFGDRPYTIWYFHGAGTSKDTGTAMRKLSAQTLSFEADLYWQGHHHVRGAQTEVRIRPGKGGQLVAQDVKLVITGSYMQSYNPQSQASLKSRGRLANYAADMGLRPHGLGGAALLLTQSKHRTYPSKVEILQ